jgi:plasmid stabilization system protein ParE
MSEYEISGQAELDLSDIWRYIAEDSPDAADRVEEAIFDACRLVAENPLIGRMQPELTQRPLRFWVVPKFSNYVLVYDPEAYPVRILRIFHGARDIDRELKRR